MKKHKRKNIKKIAMVSFGMFALILLSMVPSLIKAYTNQYDSEAEIRNSVGDISVPTDNETAKTCPNGICSSTSTELVSESTGEKFIYRLAHTNAGNRTAFAIGIEVGEKINKPDMIYEQTKIDDQKISACVAAIINQYNVDVGDKNVNLYHENNKKYNNYYYAAQKSLNVVFAANRTTFNSLVEQYKKQHFTDGIAKKDVKLDKLTHNGKEIERSDVYMKECIMAYLKTDSKGKRLSDLSNNYAKNGYVEVDSELDKTDDIIKTDMSDLYGSGASADGTNYLEAQEYNDGSYFGVSLNKVGGKSVSLTADTAKKYFYPYVYISRAQWRDGSSRYNDFQAGVCYHEASHSSACNAMFDDSRNDNYTPLAPGKYEMEITLGGKINTYGTVIYKNSNSDVTLIANNVYSVSEDDEVVFKTTFTVPEEEQTTEKGIIKIGYYLDGNINNGIEGGIFKAVNGSTVKTCTTDADGYCEIKNLDLGKPYIVSAEEVPEGYSNAKTNSGITAYETTLTSQSKTAAVSFKSSKINTTLGSITVKYLDNNNNKIPDGEFKLYKVGSSKAIDTCITNSLGECKFSNLEFGQYKVVLHEIPENYEETSQEETVSISQDKSNKTVQFRSSLKETLVKFNVVNANKKTEHIKGVKLVVKDSSGNIIKEFTSEGKVTIASDITEAGTYTVEIEEVPDGYVKGDKSFTLKVVEYQENEVTITVTPTTKVPDTFANASKIFIAAGLIGIIAGTYLLYTNAKKREEV